MIQLLFIVLHLLLALPAWSAVTFVTSATTTEAAQDNSITLNIDVGTGSNRWLACGVHFVGLATVSTVTHNGVALARSAVGLAVRSEVSIDVWHLAAPASGSLAVVATMTGTGSNKALSCLAFDGVHQTVPLGTGAKFENITDPMTANITVASGGMGIAFASNGGELEAFTPGTGQTEPFADFSDTDLNIRAMASYSSTAGANTMQFSSGFTNNGALIALPVEPAAAPPATGISAFQPIEM